MSEKLIAKKQKEILKSPKREKRPMNFTLIIFKSSVSFAIFLTVTGDKRVKRFGPH